MKNIQLMTLATTLLAGCFAKGPEVSRAEPRGDLECRDQVDLGSRCRYADKRSREDFRVYYALPRSIVFIEHPVVRRTLDRPAAPIDEQALADCNSESIEVRNSPSSLCYWNFKPAKINEKKALLQCSEDGGSIFAKKDSKPTAALVTIADSKEIYSVKLKDGPFTKLKAELELSLTGAPARYSATASSPAATVGKAALNLVGWTYSAAKINAFNFDGVKLTTDGDLAPSASRGPPYKWVVAQLAKLENMKRDLVSKGLANEAGLNAIASEQARLRRMVEGGFEDVEITLKIPFDPLDYSPSPGAEGEIAVDAQMVPAGDLCPEDDATIFLTMEPSASSVAFASMQDPGDTSTGSTGFRYRVPVSASNGLIGLVKGDKTKDLAAMRCKGEGATKCVDLEGSFAIPQWGVVRTLPRRIGYFGGALNATLDPSTGALKLVSNEAGTGGQELMMAAVEEITTDHKKEALSKQASELELRLKICKLRAEMGLSLPSSCPAPAASDE